LNGRLSSDVEDFGAGGLSDGMNCRFGNIIDWQSPRNAGRCLLRLRGGGVPKFFAWLSERYPLINHDVTSDVSMPAIDNLYLDMNGIIHPCTHGNSDELVDLTQNEMFLKIFAFLDELVHVVKPQQLLFLAIDGVAPRAKMNQQRARRFKAAKDLSEKLDKAHSRGGHVPKVLSLLALLVRKYKY
jgi:5'-3' exoribonuclease 1